MSRILPSNLTRYFYCNSGSEAVENAVKIARAVTGRQDIIAFDVSSLLWAEGCGDGGGAVAAWRQRARACLDWLAACVTQISRDALEMPCSFER